MTLSVVVASSLPTRGQQDADDEPTDDFHTLYYSAHLPTDRRLTQLLDQAERLIAEERFAEAVPFIQRVIAAEEDGFHIGPAWEIVVAGLKTRACELLKSLPPEGRTEYELQHGVAARRALRSAVEGNDLPALAAIVRAFPVTDAAAEAALVLAAGLADSGDPASAAMLVERVASWPTIDASVSSSRWIQAARLWALAGNRDRSGAAIDHVGALAPAGDSLRLNGQPITNLRRLRDQLLEVADNQAATRTASVGLTGNWLDPAIWRNEGGNSGRLTECRGGVPHLWPLWHERTLQDAQHLLGLSKRRDELLRTSRTWTIATSPVAIGNVLIARTPTQLVAIDWTTGKRVWETRPESISDEASPLTLSDRTGRGSPNMVSLGGVEQRVWFDATYGGVSTDGQRVYCIRGLAPLGGNMSRSQFGAIRVFAGRDEASTAATNALAAYDIRSEGKLLWQADGAVTSSEFAGAAFLGAPIVTEQGLFVLAELGNSVQMMMLEPDSGILLWKQTLVNLERGVEIEMGRRLTGSAPSFGNGLVICPTGAGSVVAVDPVARQLKWAFRFPVSERMVNRNAASFNRHYGSHQPALSEKWVRCRATIVGDRVLITSPETEMLFCVAIDSGKLLWSEPRDHGLFIGGVHENGVIIVGNGEVICRDAATGDLRWSVDELPDDATVGGFGITTEGRYLLPLLDGRLVVIDARDGKIAAILTARDTSSLGNLICHNGAIVSQSFDAVQRFDLAAALRERATRRLATTPDDPDALRTMAEFALLDGLTAEAVDLLRRAFEVAPGDSLIRSRMTDALMAGLAEDYAAFRESASLLDDLVPAGSRRVELLRLHVDGCRRLNDHDKSLDYAWELFELGNDGFVAVDNDHWVLSERWLNARFREIWNDGSPATRQRLGRLVEQWIGDSEPTRAIESLSRLNRFCNGIPTACDPAIDLAAALLGDDRAREAELMLLGLEGQALTAAQSQRVSSLWRKLSVRGGVSGSSPNFEWPQGRVNAALHRSVVNSSRSSSREEDAEPARLTSRTHTTRRLGPVHLSLVGTGEEVVGWNQLGEVVFRYEVELEPVSRTASVPNVRCFRFGHFCVVNQRTSVVALDLRAKPDSSGDSQLWRSRNAGRSQARYSRAFQGGLFRSMERESENPLVHARYGEVCAAGAQGVVIRNGNELSCFDSLSGDLLWRRTGVPDEGIVLADDQHVFLASDDLGVKVSLIDGSLEGPWKPIDGKLIAVSDGHYVVSKLSGGKLQVKVADATSGNVLVGRSYSSRMETARTRDNRLLMVEPSGKIDALDLTSGQILWTTQVAASAGLDTVEVFEAGDTLFVTTNTRTEAQHRAGGHEAIDNAPLASGNLYSLDARSGRPNWPRPVTLSAMGLLLIQPIESPLLVLASDHGANDSAGSAKLRLLCIDRTTGRSLYRNEDLKSLQNTTLAVRLEHGDQPRVTIALGHTLIHFDYTSLPFPPEPIARSEVEAAASRRSGGFFRAVGRFLGGSIDTGPLDTDDDD